jgi:hypothetical protein
MEGWGNAEHFKSKVKRRIRLVLLVQLFKGSKKKPISTGGPQTIVDGEKTNKEC